jgi:hypothetical protein
MKYRENSDSKAQISVNAVLDHEKECMDSYGNII